MTIPPKDKDLDRVISFAQWCERAGISEATGRRIIDAGDGPKITMLSTRRIGIRERHYLEWLDNRTEATAA